MNLAETRYLANLVKGVRAVMLVSDHEPKVQRTFINKAVAVKLFAESGFRREALLVLDEIKVGFGDDPRSAMIDKLVDELVRHWRFQNLVPGGAE